MKITWKKHTLLFKRPAGTSRSILTENTVYYIFIQEEGLIGVGECNPLSGLSLDDRPDFQDLLIHFIDIFIAKQSVDLDLIKNYPAMKFGFECALLDLKNKGRKIVFNTDFTKGIKSIPINGLLWMGSKEYMLEQLQEKIDNGFSCIKMKIGAIDFNEEISVLHEIRNHFDSDEIEIRLDANGAFSKETALSKLASLAVFDIHSIEQPIAVGQWEEMNKLAHISPIPIALDEELIPIREKAERERLLATIRPQYIILKPSLLGGFEDSDEWISLAERMGIDWWLTSALESNIGLNAIAQYAASKNNELPQGLGTGSLYTNNIDSPLFIEKGRLNFKSDKKWGAI